MAAVHIRTSVVRAVLWVHFHRRSESVEYHLKLLLAAIAVVGQRLDRVEQVGLLEHLGLGPPSLLCASLIGHHGLLDHARDGLGVCIRRPSPKYCVAPWLALCLRPSPMWRWCSWPAKRRFTPGDETRDSYSVNHGPRIIDVAKTNHR